MSHLADRNWAVAWACLHLAGCVIGSWSVTAVPGLQSVSGHPPSEWLARLPTVVIVLRLLPGSFTGPVGWTAVLATSAATARSRAAWRAVRRDSWAPDRNTCSRRNAWECVAVLRQSGWPRSRDNGWTAPAVLLAVHVGDDPAYGPGPRHGDAILIGGDGEPPPLGALYVARVVGYPPGRSRLAGGFDRRRYLDGRAITWVGRLSERRRLHDPLARLGAWLGEHRSAQLAEIRRLLPSPEAELAAAVLLGERTASTRAVSEPLANLGLAHLLAVSGLHVGIVLALLGFVIGRWVRSVGARLSLALVVLPLFVVLTGMPGSVLRASGLAILFLLAPVCGRRHDTLHALGLLLWLFVLWQPHCVWDTGVRLSFSATAGIVVVGRLLPYRRHDGFSRVRPLVTGLSASTAAVWFTLPEASAAFGFVNPFAPLANLVAVPLFSAAVWAWISGLVAAIVSPWLAEAVSSVGWLAMRLLLAASGALQAIGTVAVVGQVAFGPWRLLTWIGLTTTAVVLANAWSRRRVCRAAVVGTTALLAGGGALLIVAKPAPLTDGGPAACQFAVGQGDACLLQFPDGWSVLIDTGPSWYSGSAMAGSILPWLARRRVTQLDAVVLTHSHTDHTGGVHALSQTPLVRHWLAGETAEGSNVRADGAAATDTVLHRYGAWAVMLWRPTAAGTDHASENDRSLVVGLTRCDTLVALWTGDLESAGESWLVSRLPPVPPSGVTYWKAGHHGSATSGTPPLMSLLRPELVGVSCGVKNRYGHPDHGPYAARSDTACVARTDLDGSLYLKWDRHGQLCWSTETGPLRQKLDRRPSP